MYMFQFLKSFKIKALCTKSETLKRLCPIELQFIFVMKTFIPC